jgi:hypothetical protein
MKITAKFPGKCAKCGEWFPEGERIEWTKGGPSSHVVCLSAEEKAERDDAEAQYQAEKYAESAYERSNDAWASEQQAIEDAARVPF